MKYAAKIDIKAPADNVWTLITDAGNQHKWNSTILSITGEFKEKTNVIFLTAVSPKTPFKVAVKSVKKNEMILEGGMPLGLFRGKRVFKLTPLSENSCRFETSEVFTGPLVWLMKKVMPDLQPAFDAYASDLKIASEG
ncbi:MAG: SRPBCC domain-containing protein [Proteobacteria bacterium]|nr:SRPBCC domain-containing protein [Pseudomonadota bacterium]